MKDKRPSPRMVLSTNLRTLMGAVPALGTIKKVADASASKLSNGKVGRIYAASHTTDIDTLQDLADLFGVQPWQLLVPDLKPQALPKGSKEALLLPSDIAKLVLALQDLPEKQRAWVLKTSAEAVRLARQTMGNEEISGSGNVVAQPASPIRKRAG
jgi:hypothetical protein